MIDSELAKLVVEGLRSISQGVEAIAEKIEDGFTEEKPKKKISNILYKLKKAGKIKAVSRGVYTKV